MRIKQMGLDAVEKDRGVTSAWEVSPVFLCGCAKPLLCNGSGKMRLPTEEEITRGEKCCNLKHRGSWKQILVNLL